MDYVSRAGNKLEHALSIFGIKVAGLICADFGSNTGGFVDCLLQNGATRVYAIETGYGVLDWKLRNDSRVVVMERTNAMHVVLSERVDLITIDASWTRLDKIIPNAVANLKDSGHIIALVKPHYEAEPSMLRKGKLPDETVPSVLNDLRERLSNSGVQILAETESPILGEKGKNREFLFHITAVVSV